MNKRIVLYAENTNLAMAYIRSNNLSPQAYRIVTTDRGLFEALRGTLNAEVHILNENPMDLDTWQGMIARQVEVRAVYYRPHREK